MATDQEQLAEVQVAISKILTGGQSYSLGNRTLARANLETLQKREAVLLQRIAARSRGGIGVLGVVPVER